VPVTAATTIRLAPDLRDRLDAYCAETGAVRNRVVALALRSYLGEPTPPLPVRRDFDEIERLADVAREALRSHGR
jgi:hypothetical protein